MELNHAMIDCETLGTDPGDVVLTVGVVKFHPCHRQNVEQLKSQSRLFVFDLEESLKKGFSVSASTLRWWMQQSQRARDKAFNNGGLDKLPGSIEDQLMAMSAFLTYSTSVWANGANFDPGMLQAYYNKYNEPTPWRYSDIRCARTMYKNFPGNKHEAFADNLTAHDPVDDCIYQILKLYNIAEKHDNIAWN